MNNRGFVWLTAIVAVVALSGCTTTPNISTTSSAPAPSVPMATATPSATAMPTSVREPKDCQWDTLIGFEVGNCLVYEGTSVFTREQVLEMCHMARDESAMVSSTRQEYYTDDEWYYPQFVCGRSAGQISDSKERYPRVEGLPDKNALPADWQAGRAVESWYDGRFIIRAFDEAKNWYYDLYFDRDGHFLPTDADKEQLEADLAEFNENRPW